MIEKLERYIREEDGVKISCPPDNEHIIHKINELVDAVNGILAAQEQYATIYNEDIVPMLTPQNEEPDFITTTYLTDGHTKEYYGQNGARVQFDHPIPAGYTITITDPTPAENVQSEKIAQGFKNLQDPYAEQRKWIGKLCKFRDDETDKPVIGVLKDIDVFVGDNDALYITFINATDNNSYFECEPVKLDDDIIYRGE